MVFIFDDRLNGTPLEATVRLNLIAGDKAFSFELQRALKGAGFSTIDTIRGNLFDGGKAFIFIDSDVVAGNLYEYRGRHVRRDAIPGPFSIPVTALADFNFDDEDVGGGGGGGGGGDDERELFLNSFSPNPGDAFLL